MEKRNNSYSISDLLTPFKNKNRKLNNHNQKIIQNKSHLAEKSLSNTQLKSQEKMSLSNLIHNVSIYRKRMGDELKIDVNNIKPSNLNHIISNKSIFYQKNLNNPNNINNSNSNTQRKTEQKIIVKNDINNSNIYYTNVDDKITSSIDIEDKNDFFDLFPVEKLAKFDNKFLILLSKIKTKSTKYQRDEYIKFLEDFKLNPFYVYFLNRNQIKNDNKLILIKSSVNLIILSIICCLWVTKNNDKIINNETINKYLIDLITNNHQLYLLLCLHILNEVGYLNNEQNNSRVMRLMDQIKIYLNQKITDFDDKEMTLKEIKNSNIKINKNISKILNFENLYCVEISNCLRDLNKINISFLYSLFEKMKMNDNICITENANETNYLHSLYQQRPLSNIYNINKSMSNNVIYIKKLGNYSNGKIQNRIDNRNKNINEKDDKNIFFNDIAVDNSNNKLNSLYPRKTCDNPNQINNVFINKNYKFDITNKNKKINPNSIINIMKNYKNISGDNLDYKINDKSFSNNKTINHPIINVSENMIDYQPQYFPHKNKKFNKYQTSFENNTISSNPIYTENNYQNNNIKHNTNYSNIYCNTINNNESRSGNLTRLYKNNKINQDKFKFLSKNLNIPKIPYLPENNSGKKFTLILDLDETLVQFNYNKMLQNNSNEKIILRPGLFEFLNKIYPIFELVIWTVATKQYSDPIIDIIEEKKKYFSARLYREYATEKTNFLVKDLSKLGRNIDKIIIVDDKEVSFSLQKENGILIKPFLGNYLECKNDNVLFELFKILTKIILIKSQDVREGIKKYKYEIQQKVSKIYSKINVYEYKNDYGNNALRTDRDDISNIKTYKKYEKIFDQNNNIEKFGTYNSVKMINFQGIKNKY